MTTPHSEPTDGCWRLIRVARNGTERPIPRNFPSEHVARAKLVRLLEGLAADHADWPPTRSSYEKAAAAAARAGRPFTLPGGITYTIRQQNP
ncbi:hypothetical protein AB0C84_44425 [Actinomadura sp. NPDC048955]|uniref:hypothetical protein n=1 Tax=Actinomadura sp. NPDC048955 TaxID=3158228 RepID=UPI00340E2CA7